MLLVLVFAKWSTISPHIEVQYLIVSYKQVVVVVVVAAAAVA